MKTYAGFYEGIVTSILAPASEPAGAVKVRIPEIHGTATEVPDTSLPWAVPNFMFAGSQAGLIGVPPVNAIVHVIFKHGNKDFPMWIGGGHRTTDVPSQFLSAKEGTEPRGWMWITPGGYGIVINEKLKTIELKTPQPSLSSIKIDLTTKKVEAISNATGSTQYQLVLDETNQKASIVTPSGQTVDLNEATGEVKLEGTSKAILTAALMEIGIGASEAAVLGTAFSTLYNGHKHLGVQTGAGTSGTPDPASLMLPGLHTSAFTKIK